MDFTANMINVYNNVTFKNGTLNMVNTINIWSEVMVNIAFFGVVDNKQYRSVATSIMVDGRYYYCLETKNDSGSYYLDYVDETVESQPTQATESNDPSESLMLLGDANIDGVVDVLDATHIQRFSAGIIVFSEMELDLADIDCDTNANVIDATLIQKHLVGHKTGYSIGEPIK